MDQYTVPIFNKVKDYIKMTNYPQLSIAAMEIFNSLATEYK